MFAGYYLAGRISNLKPDAGYLTEDSLFPDARMLDIRKILINNLQNKKMHLLYSTIDTVTQFVLFFLFDIEQQHRSLSLY